MLILFEKGRVKGFRPILAMIIISWIVCCGIAASYTYILLDVFKEDTKLLKEKIIDSRQAKENMVRAVVNTLMGSISIDIIDSIDLGLAAPQKAAIEKLDAINFSGKSILWIANPSGDLIHAKEKNDDNLTHLITNNQVRVTIMKSISFQDTLDELGIIEKDGKENYLIHTVHIKEWAWILTMATPVTDISLEVKKMEEKNSRRLNNSLFIAVAITLFSCLLLSLAVYFVYMQLTIASKKIDEKNELLEKEITEKEILTKRMISTARRAGMAEMASGVLHNVGNVLNSVNVQVDFVVEKLKNLKIKGIVKSLNLMDDHRDDLGNFLKNDIKGKLIPDYLKSLGEDLESDQSEITADMTELAKNVENIKIIVGTYQDYAKGDVVNEFVSIHEVVNDVIEINRTTLNRNDTIIINKTVDEIMDFQSDRGKILQILMNLISNARHATLNLPKGKGRIIVKTQRIGIEGVMIEVSDNGVGIPKENCEKIFNYGFSTKAKGHGFGLHSAALAAKALKGSLTVHSEGPEKGTTFILKIRA